MAVVDSTSHMDAVERHTLEQARATFDAHPHDVACFIMETVQGEGGDHHVRPLFLAAMLDLCPGNDALFVLDEVRTGGGLVGLVGALPLAYVARRIQPWAGVQQAGY